MSVTAKCSCNKQQHAMTTLPRLMGMIKAIIGCHGHDQHHYCDAPKYSWDEFPSNLTRKAVAISLGATRQPCQRTQQRPCEDIVSITMILIPWWQLLSQKRQLSQCKHSKHNHEPGGPLNGNLRQIGKIHASDLLRQEHWDQQQNTG